MKISFVTDEISADLETALELVQRWGGNAVELRGIGEQRYPAVDNFWKQRVPDLINRFGCSVAALSPGLFKIPYPAPPHPATRILRWEDAMVFNRYQDAEKLVRYHLETLLPETISAAKLLGARIIVCFSFERGVGVSPEAPVPDAVIDVFKDAARLVQSEGLILAIEVEHICWGDIGRRTAKLVERVANPALGINWDPANACRAGENRPYPDDYAAVRGMLSHVHCKNCHIDPVTGERCFMFDGMVDWKGQIAALIHDDYHGYISVEPHDIPKVEKAKKTYDMLCAYIKEAMNE